MKKKTVISFALNTTEFDSTNPNYLDDELYIFIFKNLDEIIKQPITNLSQVVCQPLLNSIMTDPNKKSWNKKILNTLIGCLGSDHFKLSSFVLYNIITAIGRRIIMFVCEIIHCLCTQKSVNIDFFNFKSTPIHNISNIIQLNTDGLYILGDKDLADRICKTVNGYFLLGLNNLYFDISSIHLKYKLQLINEAAMVVNNQIYFIDNYNKIYPPKTDSNTELLLKRIFNNETLKYPENVFTLQHMKFISYYYLNNSKQINVSTICLTIDNLEKKILQDGFLHNYCLILFYYLQTYINNFDVSEWLTGKIKLHTQFCSLNRLSDKYIQYGFLKCKKETHN